MSISSHRLFCDAGCHAPRREKAGHWISSRREEVCWITPRNSRAVSEPRWNILSGVSRAILVAPRFAIEGRSRTPPTDNTGCVEQLVDGQKADSSRGYWMSATARWGRARQTGEKTLHPSQYVQDFDEIAFCDSSNNRLTVNSRFCWGCAGRP